MIRQLKLETDTKLQPSPTNAANPNLEKSNPQDLHAFQFMENPSLNPQIPESFTASHSHCRYTCCYTVHYSMPGANTQYYPSTAPVHLPPGPRDEEPAGAVGCIAEAVDQTALAGSAGIGCTGPEAAEYTVPEQEVLVAAAVAPGSCRSL